MLRIFTLKFQSTLGAFDDAELQAFIKDKEVVSIRDHFFTKDDMPYLTVLVTYQLAGPPTDVSAAESASTTSRNEKWREILEEGDWPLFNTLREWRNRLANEEGVPPYVIATNRQLAHIAHRRPPTLEQLGHIEGVGQAKLKRYGAAILEAVQPQADAEAEAQANGGE